MTLPFQPPSGRRKYRCFVCGVDYTDFDEFKEHVTSEHEEGREYISCKICGAPVRDLSLHYKVKHSGKKMQSGQRRATIWYDFSGTKRKAKRPNYKQGIHISPKNDWREMTYRSGYELEVYKLLDELNEIRGYEVEPKDCVTPYYWNGKWRKYHPDLKVVFTDNHTEIWEIKPSNQTDFDQNQEKWKAAAGKMSDHGWVFGVKTEQGINKLRRLIVEQNRSR